jgi:MFS family permease
MVGRTLASFHNRNFRLYWSGQLVSLIGTLMQIVGQSWLVLDLTHSSIALGFVAALQSAPVLVTVLFAGVVVDRLPKHKLLLVTQSLLLLQASVLAFLTISGRVQLWHVYVLAAVLGLLNAFDNPTRQSFVADIVEREDMVNAVGLASAQFNAGKLIGPAIGGLVIARWGTGGCFLLNALSFLAVLVSLILMRPQEFPVRTGAGPRPRSIIGGLLEGMRYFLSKPDLATAIIVLCGLGPFIYSTSQIIPLIAQDALNVDAAKFGLMVSAVGFGSLISALVIATHGKSTVKLVLTAAALFCGLYLALAFVPEYISSLVVLALVGFALQWFGTLVATLLQLGSLDHFRGRAMSVFSLLTNGSQPLSALFMGFMAAWVGIRMTIAAEAAISGLALMLALIYRARVTGPPASEPVEAAPAPRLGEPGGKPEREPITGRP